MNYTYEIKTGTLGYKYVVQVAFDDKENLEPLIRVIKQAFVHFERQRERLEKARALEEKEKRENVTPGGPLQ